MATLLLRLAGPLQAWGDSSRFTRRETRTEPTKSGILGLLAAAEGRRRSDPIADLLALSFGVRVDQPGRIVRDFQTAIRWTSTAREAMPLSYRYYLSDAVFVAAVGGDRALIDGLHEALAAPVYPPFLGRRSCPPSRPLVVGVVDDDVERALRSAEWEASDHHRRTLGTTAQLPLIVDAGDAPTEEVIRDQPHSFDPVRREYGWRPVHRPDPVVVTNPNGREGVDFFDVVAGA